MALTENGLVVEKFPEVVTSIEESQQELIDPNIDTTDDTLIGQLNSIFGERIAAVNELVQAVYDARSLNKAEGQALDDLVQILNIVRQQASKTTGTERFTGVDGTVLTSGSVVSNATTKDQYELINSLDISSQACVSLDITVNNVQNNEVYSLTIDGIAISYTSDVDATAQEIVEGLKADIDSQTNVNFQAVEDDVTLTISSIDGNNISLILGTTFLSIGEVSVESTIQAVNTGPLVAGPNTITTVETTTFGLNSVTNPNSLITGRDLETDEELRARAQISGSSSGKATVDAIISSLLAVQNVTGATVDENITLAVVDGVAAKGFRVVVVGGTDEDVAQSIWDNKPAGIETSGDITVSTVTDAFGGTQSIKFSRPTSITINTIVEYTMYDEEVAPTNIDSLISDAVEAEFQKLVVGNDVIPKRFYGPIYNAASGIEQLTVLMGTIPIPTAEDTISIGSDEIAVSGTVVVNDVTP